MLPYQLATVSQCPNCGAQIAWKHGGGKVNSPYTGKDDIQIHFEFGDWCNYSGAWQVNIAHNYGDGFYVGIMF